MGVAAHSVLGKEGSDQSDSSEGDAGDGGRREGQDKAWSTRVAWSSSPVHRELKWWCYHSDRRQSPLECRGSTDLRRREEEEEEVE